MAEVMQVLMAAVQQGASDILLTPREHPVIRAGGVLKRIDGFGPPNAAECKRWIYSMLGPKEQQEFERRREADFAFALGDLGRFRVNVFVQADGVAAALRFVPPSVPQPGAIGLTQAIVNLTNLPRGLVLVTGPTGSGKSTTLAALIEAVNATQSKHVLTIEDPIEFIYKNRRSTINQREVGTHTASFHKALRYALRQNPDIILVGEMRDAETIGLALAAAETGHLCFSTLHTQDAASTVNRIIDEFPHEQQEKVRGQLCSVLSAVVSQALLPRRSGGLVCAREIMVMNAAVASLIRERKINQLYGAIESGAAAGMISMDQHLAQLVAAGEVELADAALKARDPQALRSLVLMGAARPIAR